MKPQEELAELYIMILFVCFMMSIVGIIAYEWPLWTVIIGFLVGFIICWFVTRISLHESEFFKNIK